MIHHQRRLQLLHYMSVALRRFLKKKTYGWPRSKKSRMAKRRKQEGKSSTLSALRLIQPIHSRCCERDWCRQGDNWIILLLYSQESHVRDQHRLPGFANYFITGKGPEWPCYIILSNSTSTVDLRTTRRRSRWLRSCVTAFCVFF